MNKMQLLCSKSFSRICLAVVVLCSLVLSACSNFMDDDDEKNKLSREITVANSVAPEVIDVEPFFQDSGVQKNKKIIINFSKSMNPDTFWSSITITDSLGNNLKSHYEAPVWSNENRTVEIPAKQLNLIDLSGKKYMDIYLAISKSCEDKDALALQKAVEFKYRIIDEIDTIPPQAGTIRAELPLKYISNTNDSSVIKLFEGVYNAANEAAVCTTNHINNKLNFYIEGSDFGGAEVWADFEIKRMYDVSGKALNEPATKKSIKLTEINYTANFYFDTVCVDLSDSTYIDGMYRITARISDSVGMLSEQSTDYYVIRDTSLGNTATGKILFELPEFTKDSTATKKAIQEYSYRIQIDPGVNDVYFISKLNNRTREYKQAAADLTYMISWGTSFNDLTVPVKLPKYKGSLGSNLSLDKYEMPASYKSFREENLDEDICVRVTLIDKVGNKNYIDTLVPKQVDFFNYELAVEEDNTQTRTLKLNFADLSNEFSHITTVKDKDIHIDYQIFYAEKNQGSVADDEELSLKHSEFEIKQNTEYVVYILPVYSLSSKSTGSDNGTTLGPLYKVEIPSSNTSTAAIKVPSFTVDKASAGVNTGKYDITVTIPSDKVVRGYEYYPCFSTNDTDEKNWNIYKAQVDKNSDGSMSLTFRVDNPYTLPVDSALWYETVIGKSYFDLSDSDYAAVQAYVKLLVVNGNSSCYTDAVGTEKLVFTITDDNIPPSVRGGFVQAHDSKLSYDGRYYKFGSVVIEDQFNAVKEITYYYTDYTEAWGNDLSVLSNDEIKALPSASSYIDSGLFIEDGRLTYNLNPVIPVNGLKDGKYMFFAKVSDKKGNSDFITLGKADIGTFGNKLEVVYKNNKFGSALKVSTNEKLERYFMSVQKLNEDVSAVTTGPYNVGWVELDNKNALKEASFNNYIVTAESDNVTTGRFYRINVQGFNEHVYNSDNREGVNYKYGKPYSDNDKDGIVDETAGNVGPEYDVCTNETVSNTVYYYVPAENEDMSKTSIKFVKNTGSFSSNKPAIVNIISSLNNLGDDIDEWERRGKIIKTYYFPGETLSYTNTFRDSDAIKAMFDSDEVGYRHFVIVVHFANNTSKMSAVYTSTID